MSTRGPDRDEFHDLEWLLPEEGDCTWCGGSGGVVCDAFGCEGSGCPLCLDGERTCPECGGSGFKDTCDDTGEDD